MHTKTLKLIGVAACALGAFQSTSALAQSDADIVVTAQRENQTQVLREGSLGALGDKSALELPFAVKAYDATLILNQQSQTLGQVLENDPSVRTTYGFGNASEQFVIRGFPLYGEDIAIDGLYGITPRQLVSPELYDQVQILNGASAFLFGAAPGGTAVGGTVNVLPKRATGRLLARVTANYNSEAHFGGAFDIGQRFGEDESFGVRVNGAGRWGDISIDDEYRSSTVLGVGTDWRSERVRVSLDVAYQRVKVEHMRPMVQVADPTGLPEAPDDASINYGQDWNFTTLRDVFGILKAEWDITDDFMLYGAIGARDGAERGTYQGFTVLDADTGAAYATGSTIPRNDNNESAQIGLRAQLDGGFLTHEFNAGISAIRQVNRNAFAFGSFAGTPTNLYNPIDVPEPPFTAFIGGDLDDPFARTRLRQFSMFFSDTIGAFDERVELTVGIRRQRINLRTYNYYNGGLLENKYDEETTTPVFGLVVRPTEQISLYANRIEALVPGESAPVTAVNFGTVFPPYRAKQHEFGAKVDLGRWAASVALFETERPFAFVDPQTNIFGIFGEQRNRGIEVSMDGEPIDGLRIISGFSIIDAELDDGNAAPGVPELTANANVEWDTPFFPGFTLTGRVVYTSEQYFNTANTLEIPSWTRFDLGARYVMAVAETPVTLRVNVDNVANESYWVSALGGYLVQGLPRTVKASVTVDF